MKSFTADYNDNIKKNIASAMATQIRRKNNYFIINMGSIDHNAFVTIEYRKWFIGHHSKHIQLETGFAKAGFEPF